MERHFSGRIQFPVAAGRLEEPVDAEVWLGRIEKIK
jgi:hypothetical protein